MEIGTDDKIVYDRLKQNLEEAGIFNYIEYGKLVKNYNLSVDIPDDAGFVYTDQGKASADAYIQEMAAKRKEILDAGKDTADDTTLPTAEEILEDVQFNGLDDEGEYYNGWAVTDSCDADYPILLKLGRDILLAA